MARYTLTILITPGLSSSPACILLIFSLVIVAQNIDLARAHLLELIVSASSSRLRILVRRRRIRTSGCRAADRGSDGVAVEVVALGEQLLQLGALAVQVSLDFLAAAGCASRRS
jgi:hypothetical protein